MERPDPPSFVAHELDAFKLAAAVTADSAPRADFGELLPRHATEVGSSARECASSGLGSKIRKSAETAEAIDQIADLTEAVARLKLSRKSDASLRPTASGLRCRDIFPEATRRRRFPAKEKGVLAWSSFFATSRTFLV